MSAQEERRLNAVKAAYAHPCSDAARGSETVRAMIGKAIKETARVQITGEVLSAFRENAGVYERGLKAAFEAAGFEVEE